MSRGLTTAMIAAASLPQLWPVYFVEMVLSDGTQRWTTHTRSLSWDGYTWISSPNLVDLGEVTDGEETAAQSISMTLSGVAISNIALALDDQYVGSRVTIWLGLLDDARAIVADPFVYFAGSVDEWSFDEDYERGSSQVKLTIVTGLPNFDRITGRQDNTPSNAQFFSTDTFFDHTSAQFDLSSWKKA